MKQKKYKIPFVLRFFFLKGEHRTNDLQSRYAVSDRECNFSHAACEEKKSSSLIS